MILLLLYYIYNCIPLHNILSHTAHHKLQCGKLLYNYGEVDGAGINRSPSSYLRNPAAERDKYSGNTDKEMVVLKITDHKDKGLGMIR